MNLCVEPATLSSLHIIFPVMKMLCKYGTSFSQPRTLNDQSSSVGGSARHAGRRALEPCRVFRSGGGNMQRRPSAISLDAVSTAVVSVRQHPAVSLPAHHRHRNADRLRGELHRLTLDNRLVDHSIDKPRWLSRCPSCRQKLFSCELS
jgi:hypothetical protein